MPMKLDANSIRKLRIILRNGRSNSRDGKWGFNASFETTLFVAAGFLIQECVPYLDQRARRLEEHTIAKMASTEALRVAFENGIEKLAYPPPRDEFEGYYFSGKPFVFEDT